MYSTGQQKEYIPIWFSPLNVYSGIKKLWFLLQYRCEDILSKTSDTEAFQTKSIHSFIQNLSSTTSPMFTVKLSLAFCIFRKHVPSTHKSIVINTINYALFIFIFILWFKSLYRENKVRTFFSSFHFDFHKLASSSDTIEDCWETNFKRLAGMFCKTCEKPDGEPVEDLNSRDKAKTEAEATKSTDVGDEFKTGHLLRPLIFWVSIVKSMLNGNHLPNTVESPKKRFNTAMSRS